MLTNPWRTAIRNHAAPSEAEIACAEAQARLLAEWWHDGESTAANLASIEYWLSQAASGASRPGAE